VLARAKRDCFQEEPLSHAVRALVLLLAGITASRDRAAVLQEAQVGRDIRRRLRIREYFYGFVGVGLAWQITFLIIARDPARFRPIMIGGILEKVLFGLPGTSWLTTASLRPRSVGFAALTFCWPCSLQQPIGRLASKRARHRSLRALLAGDDRRREPKYNGTSLSPGSSFEVSGMTSIIHFADSQDAAAIQHLCAILPVDRHFL